MGLERTTSGLLAFRGSTAASTYTDLGATAHSTGEYTAGTGGTLALDGDGTLVMGGTTGALIFFRFDTITSRGKTLLVARLFEDSNGRRGGPVIHLNDITNSSEDGVGMTTYSGGVSALQEYVNASAANLATGTSVPALTHHAVMLFADDTAVRAYSQHVDEYFPSASDATSSFSSGQFGFVVSSDSDEIRCTVLVISTDRFLTVDGLDTGQTVEVRKADDTVLSSGTESGGSASIDMIEVQPWEALKLVVLDEETPVETLTLTDDILVGGDVYEVTEDDPGGAVSGKRGLHTIKHGFVPSLHPVEAGAV